MTFASPTLVAQHDFLCACCNQNAGHVSLYKYDERDWGYIVRDSFASKARLPVPAEHFESVRAAALAGDIQSLYKFN